MLKPALQGSIGDEQKIETACSRRKSASFVIQSRLSGKTPVRRRTHGLKLMGYKIMSDDSPISSFAKLCLPIYSDKGLFFS